MKTNRGFSKNVLLSIIAILSVSVIYLLYQNNIEKKDAEIKQTENSTSTKDSSKTNGEVKKVEEIKQQENTTQNTQSAVQNQAEITTCEDVSYKIVDDVRKRNNASGKVEAIKMSLQVPSNAYKFGNLPGGEQGYSLNIIDKDFYGFNTGITKLDTGLISYLRDKYGFDSDYYRNSGEATVYGTTGLIRYYKDGIHQELWDDFYDIICKHGYGSGYSTDKNYLSCACVKRNCVGEFVGGEQFVGSSIFFKGENAEIRWLMPDDYTFYSCSIDLIDLSNQKSVGNIIAWNKVKYNSVYKINWDFKTVYNNGVKTEIPSGRYQLRFKYEYDNKPANCAQQGEFWSESFEIGNRIYQ